MDTDVLLGLRAYQVEAINEARAQVRAGKRAPLLCAPPGAGKTKTAAYMAASHIAKGGRVAWFSPRIELVQQAADALSDTGAPHDRWVSMTYQGVLARGEAPEATMGIFDECVTGDTLVGGRRADLLRVGDFVESWDGSAVRRRPITHVFRNTAHTLRTLHVGGVRLTVTDSHPIWVEERGWIRAVDVQVGDLCRVRRTDEAFRAPERARVAEDVQPAVLRRQGTRHDNAATIPAARSWPAVVGRAPDVGLWSSPGDVRASEVHLSRLGRPGDSTGNRSRRPISRRHGSTGRGSSEGSVLALSRVDRIEVHEPGGDGTFGGRAPDGRVYNFEVADDHNFFANGILTHNCHWLPSAGGEFKRVIEAYLRTIRVGLTATPERADGSALAGFDCIVTISSYSELIELGHLVPCQVYSPDHVLKSKEIIARPVDAYLDKCRGELAVCFGPTVEACQRFCDEFRGLGVRAEVVHARSKDREDILARWRSRETMVVVNVGVLTEGFDLPEISCVILARMVGTCGLFLQTTGRGLRPFPGKQRMTLLDLSGAANVHGSPTCDREYSLDGTGIRQAGVEMPTGTLCAICGNPPPCDCGGREQTEIAVTGSVRDLKPWIAAMRREPDDERAVRLARWFRECERKGHSEKAAKMKFKALYDRWPSSDIVNAALRLCATKPASAPPAPESAQTSLLGETGS